MEAYRLTLKTIIRVHTTKLRALYKVVQRPLSEADTRQEDWRRDEVNPTFIWFKLAEVFLRTVPQNTKPGRARDLLNNRMDSVLEGKWSDVVGLHKHSEVPLQPF